ncbi:MAG TPA: response regulator transcription factor [Candidatus Acidoferrales bacterium]|nr:response regulator transcription factor [Candidatus Acidoferrales bacterium]
MSRSSPRTLRETPSEVAPARTRLLVADETPMGCQLLQTAFKVYQDQFEVVACAVSSASIASCFKHTPIDVALISADLEDGHFAGLQALRELRTAYPDTPVVVLFNSLQDDSVLDAFCAGAQGVIGRGEPVESLCKCIQAVQQGQVWANSAQVRLLLKALTDVRPTWAFRAHGLSLLSKREGQVVGLVVDGLTNREIAVELGIVEHTVSNYLFRIYNKLGISSRVELVLYCVNQGEAGQVPGDTA